MRDHRSGIVAITVVVALNLGGHVPGTAPVANAQPAGSARYFAGAARVDITPVPGLSTAGHGPLHSAIARGYWDRLQATAFYFEDASGIGFAMLSADLFAVPSGLHQSVAAHFTGGNPENLTRVVLPLDRIVLAATHTHHAPGNHLSSELYNSQAAKVAGYNPQFRAFLSRQFIRAVELAITDARGSSDSFVDVQTSTVSRQLFLNRSPGVFMLNDDRTRILDSLGGGIPGGAQDCVDARHPSEPDKDWRIDGCPRLRAVDRNITLLRIRRQSRTHAIAIFVNAHPTVLPGRTEIFSGDLFGITRALLRSPGSVSGAIIGFFNGAEGDVVARRRSRTARDLHRLASLLAQRIRETHDTAGGSPVDLASGITAALHFARAGQTETTSAGMVRLAATPVAGVATLGGGEGDPSGFPGKPTTQKPTGDQGVKVPALRWFHDVLAPSHSFPQALPISYVRLGSLRLAFVPTESSTAAVWRMRQALGRRPHGELEVVSMANEYASYLATMDEYQAQDYMGASTFWGPQQSAFFTEILTRAANGAVAPGRPGPDRPGPERTFRLGNVGLRRLRARDGFAAFLAGGEVSPRDLPAFKWCGAAPTTIALPRQEPHVVSISSDFKDDAGVAVILHGPPRAGRVEWSALWLTPLWERPQGRFKFRVLEGGRWIESDPFAVGEPIPAKCDNE